MIDLPLRQEVMVTALAWSPDGKTVAVAGPGSPGKVGSALPPLRAVKQHQPAD